jgi:hypothetical protein
MRTDGWGHAGALVAVFRVYEQLIQDYRSFTEGFIEIQNQRIRQRVEQQAAQSAQSPPWLALNPPSPLRDAAVRPRARPDTGA